MKFIGPVLGRCVYLFAWEEVRPPHGEAPALLSSALVERYHFRLPPEFKPDASIPFKDGFVLIDDAPIAIPKLEIYSDGFTVDCQTTDDAEKVAADMIAWAKSRLGYRDFVRPPRKSYVSQIVVEFETAVEGIFKRWNELQALLSKPLQAHYGMKESVDLLRLGWRCDPYVTLNAVMLSEISIERRASEPHPSNRFFCSAPLPTQEAASLFQEFERIIAG